jgi:hypothetical protein
MMTSPDGNQDNSTVSTHNCSVHTRSPSPFASVTNKKLAKAQRAKLFPLKFEYNVSAPNVQIAQLHGQQVVKALIQTHGDDITVLDKDDNK